jgi:hypothetical protein
MAPKAAIGLVAALFPKRIGAARCKIALMMKKTAATINTLGKFTGDPSFAGRLGAFNDAIEKLLLPDKRLNKDSIWRTQNECTLHLRKEFVPKPLRGLGGTDGYIKDQFRKEHLLTCWPI